MFVPLIALALSSQPATVEEVQYRSHDVATALARGCRVQRVSVAAGKAEHAPIIRCPSRQVKAEDTARKVPKA